MSWHEAVRYCAVAQRKDRGITTGRNFRLPTEAEWSARRAEATRARCFRGGTRRRNPYPTMLIAVPRLEERPRARGRAEPNAYGLYNMCDNVHEWCSDWYSPDYYAESPERNPRGPETG